MPPCLVACCTGSLRLHSEAWVLRLAPSLSQSHAASGGERALLCFMVVLTFLYSWAIDGWSEINRTGKRKV